MKYFANIKKIKYEGPKSDNPLAFKYYNPKKKVGRKTMEQHLRFAVCYWHNFCGMGGDPFGGDTRAFPWLVKDPMQTARNKMDAAFEFMSKLSIPFYCFHDVDMVAEGASIKEAESRLATMVDYAKQKQKATGIKLLWGTANLFSHKRYMNGAATNPDFAVVTHAATQVKNAIDATIALGGKNYVFWGGREGYMSLLNTNAQHQYEARAGTLSSFLNYGARLRKKARFQRHLSH